VDLSCAVLHALVLRLIRGLLATLARSIRRAILTPRAPGEALPAIAVSPVCHGLSLLPARVPTLAALRFFPGSDRHLHCRSRRSPHSHSIVAGGLLVMS